MHRQSLLVLLTRAAVAESLINLSLDQDLPDRQSFISRDSFWKVGWLVMAILGSGGGNE